jgi:hypothetical protein
VDHHGCGTPCALEPGGWCEWTMEIVAPATAAGASALRGSIAVVDPLSCRGARRCLSVEFESEAVPFRVRAPDTPPSS